LSKFVFRKVLSNHAFFPHSEHNQSISLQFSVLQACDRLGRSTITKSVNSLPYVLTSTMATWY